MRRLLVVVLLAVLGSVGAITERVRATTERVRATTEPLWARWCDGRCAPSAPPAAEPAGWWHGKKVYLLELSGELGRDYAAGPLKEILRDAAQERADAVVLSVDSRSPAGVPPDAEVESYMITRYQQAGEILRLCHAFARGEFPGEMCGEPPRVIVWIKDARGISSSLLWAADEVYFAPGAKCGCGELWAAQARAWMEGKLKHQQMCDPGRVQRASAESVQWPAEETSQPPSVYWALHQTNYELEPKGDGLLRLAKVEVRDPELAESYVSLAPDTAFQLGVSRGLAPSIEDLVRVAGLGDARITRGASDAILRRWSEALPQAEENVILNLRLAQIVERCQQGPEDWSAACREMWYLDRVLDTLNEFGDAMDRKRLGAWPSVLRADVGQWYVRLLLGEKMEGPVVRMEPTLEARRFARGLAHRRRGKPRAFGPPVSTRAASMLTCWE